MTEFVNVLFDWLATTDLAQYAALLAFIGYTLSGFIQYLPVSVTEKIPDIVMTIINLLAQKHGNDKAALTDIKGNPVE